MSRLLPLVTCLLFTSVASAQQQKPNPREVKVRGDKEKVEAAGYWIYNDLPKAFAEAKKTGKPIVVVLRCIPCEECVKLDDDLVNEDPVLKPLLEKFVRCRVVSTNGLDLSLFQFDTDQSFAVFFLNADGTIYGRFGTRSHRTNWVGDVSIAGLAKALEGALALHADYPKNKASLAGKKGPALEFPSPEKYPTLTGKYTAALKYEGNVVQSCIHCHQIGDARRVLYWTKKQTLPEELTFPYPHPKAIGLVLDPKEKATVTTVTKRSPAEKAGFKPGDAITTLAGQPLLSMADVQCVLHRADGNGAKVSAEVVRDGKSITLTLDLAAGWKAADDISWRVSTWGFRRMVLGGMVVEDAPAGSGATLRVKSVGQSGAHAAAKNAGVKPGDLIVAYSGRKDFVGETDLILYALMTRTTGDTAKVTLLRDGKPVEVTIPIQD
jgi:hypothetical protein